MLEPYRAGLRGTGRLLAQGCHQGWVHSVTARERASVREPANKLVSKTAGNARGLSNSTQTTIGMGDSMSRVHT